MKSSTLQSLIKRNATEIHCTEIDIASLYENIKFLRTYSISTGVNVFEKVQQDKKEISIMKGKLRKLVAIQKELKKELKSLSVRKTPQPSIFNKVLDWFGNSTPYVPHAGWPSSRSK